MSTVTRNQRDILQRLADGQAPKQIARATGISYNNVRHILCRQLYPIFKVHSMTDLMIKAFVLGLVR